MNYSEMSTEELKDLEYQTEAKIAALHNKQLALKILINSAYGALASPYFRYFGPELAKSITMSGQLSIKWLYQRLEKYLMTEFNLDKSPYIYSDTDSCYFSLDFVAKKIKEKDPQKVVDYIDKFSKKIVEPKIDEIYEKLATYVNANENKMKMKQEKISEKFLQTGKKRYAALVWDDEGVRYDHPQLKITGIEIVRSSTPKIIKPYLKKFISEIMYNPENIQTYIKEVKEKFFKMHVEEIAFPRSVSEVNKYTDINKIYKKGCPIGVRAALIYNKYIQDNDIEMEQVYDGEKIKFIYTLVPNPFSNENVFGFVNRVPNKEIISNFVDYNKQFDKVFFNVVENIADKAGYNISKKQQVNIEDLF